MDKCGKNKFTEEIKEMINDIHLDNTSSSIELTRKAIDVFKFLLKNHEINENLSLKYLVQRTAMNLVRAQYAMAAIFNLSNKILLNIENINNEIYIKKVISLTCKRYINRINESNKIISELVFNLIDDNSLILVHSFSETVFKTLIYANKKGKNFNVICTESRPLNEGVILANKLGKEGIKVKLIIDFAVFSFLPKIDLTLVGADALSSRGLINKIGTLGIATASNSYKTALYSLCGSEKVLPLNYKFDVISKKNPKEVQTEKIKNVTPINYYFDVTPYSYFTGFVTEKGIMSDYELEKYMKNIRIHKILF